MDSQTQTQLDEALGCSKCRFSRRGCKRCRDPEFQIRQKIKKQEGGQRSTVRRSSATRQHAGPTRRKGGSKDYGRPTREDGNLTACASKRTRTAGAQAARLGASCQATLKEQEQGAHARTTARQHPPDHRAIDAPQNRAHHRKRSSNKDSESRLEEPQPSAQPARSGLELGLVAALLPLPEHAVRGLQPLEDAIQSADAHAEPSADRQSTGASPSSTSQQSSQSSLARALQLDFSRRGQGVDSGSAQSQRQPGDGKDEMRQKRFMELLQSNMEQRQQARKQGDGALTLAAALASGARAKKVPSAEF